jgi:hypothetical protein
MPVLPGQTPRRGPSPVPVHDDRDVGGNASRVHIGQTLEGRRRRIARQQAIERRLHGGIAGIEPGLFAKI